MHDIQWCFSWSYLPPVMIYTTVQTDHCNIATISSFRRMDITNAHIYRYNTCSFGRVKENMGTAGGEQWSYCSGIPLRYGMQVARVWSF